MWVWRGDLLSSSREATTDEKLQFHHLITQHLWSSASNFCIVTVNYRSQMISKMGCPGILSCKSIYTHIPTTHPGCSTPKMCPGAHHIRPHRVRERRDPWNGRKETELCPETGMEVLPQLCHTFCHLTSLSSSVEMSRPAWLPEERCVLRHQRDQKKIPHTKPWPITGREWAPSFLHWDNLQTVRWSHSKYTSGVSEFQVMQMSQFN